MAATEVVTVAAVSLNFVFATYATLFPSNSDLRVLFSFDCD